jgi:hypothetical protein
MVVHAGLSTVRRVFPAGRSIVPPRGVPLRVEYALPPLGRSLLETVAALTAWAEDHIVEVLKSREVYDAERSTSASR